MVASRSPAIEAAPAANAGARGEVEARAEARESDGPDSALTVSGGFDAAAAFQARPDAPAPEKPDGASSAWLSQQMDAMRDRVADMTQDRDVGDPGGTGFQARFNDLIDRADSLLGRRANEGPDEGDSDGLTGRLYDIQSRADALLGRDDDGDDGLAGRLDALREAADGLLSGRANDDSVLDGLDGLRERGGDLLGGLRNDEGPTGGDDSATTGGPDLGSARLRDEGGEGVAEDRPSLLAELFDGDRAMNDADPLASLRDLTGDLGDDDEAEPDLIGDLWVSGLGDGPILPDPFDTPGG